MSDVVLVDIEAILVGYLHSDELPVSTELPANLPLPRVQLWRLGGTHVTPETQWIERARAQFAAWGNTKTEAFDAAAKVCALLAELPTAELDAVFSDVTIEQTPFWSRDPESNDARYLFTVALTVHP